MPPYAPHPSSPSHCHACRRFLLEWLSFQHRYIPVGLLDVLPQRMDWRVPVFVGRSDLETLLASDHAGDWVRISEMLLGPAPPVSKWHICVCVWSAVERREGIKGSESAN